MTVEAIFLDAHVKAASDSHKPLEADVAHALLRAASENFSMLDFILILRDKRRNKSRHGTHEYECCAKSADGL